LTLALTFSQLISHLGFRPHRHVYTTMTQLNLAYNRNIINMSTLTHALWLLVPWPSLRKPSLPGPSLPAPGTADYHVSLRGLHNCDTRSCSCVALVRERITIWRQSYVVVSGHVTDDRVTSSVTSSENHSAYIASNFKRCGHVKTLTNSKQKSNGTLRTS